MTDKKEKEPGKDLSKNLQEIIQKIEKLTVLELADLVKALEDKFGVTAAAPAAIVGAVPGANTETKEEAEEKDAYDVMMTNAGGEKINVIKAIRKLRPDLGLKEAKDMTEKLPATVMEQAKKEEAQTAKKTLEEAGAKVELK